MCVLLKVGCNCIYFLNVFFPEGITAFKDNLILRLEEVAKFNMSNGEMHDESPDKCTNQGKDACICPATIQPTNCALDGMFKNRFTIIKHYLMATT